MILSPLDLAALNYAGALLTYYRTPASEAAFLAVEKAHRALLIEAGRDAMGMNE